MPKVTSGYGYGSIYQRSSDGRWVAAVALPGERGSRNRKVFIGTSREEVAALLADYREENPAPERPGRDANMGRARELGRHKPREWWALFRSVKGRCYYCGQTTDFINTPRDHPLHTEKDHVIPVTRGGSDGIDNIAVACHACNVEKATMTGDEYRAWKARRP